MQTPSSQYIFAYGTLKSNQPEHARFCSHTISIQKAKMYGCIYQLPEGYPVLRIDPSQILANATSDTVKDWQSLSEKQIAGDPAAGHGQLIEGELLELPLQGNAFAELDEWECFAPGRQSAYQRYLVTPNETETGQPYCWVFATTQPSPLSKKIDAVSWQRPPFI